MALLKKLVGAALEPFEFVGVILLHELVNLVRIAADVLKEAGLTGVTRNAGRVREQVMNRHLLACVFSISRQVIRQLRVEFDFPLLD